MNDFSKSVQPLDTPRAGDLRGDDKLFAISRLSPLKTRAAVGSDLEGLSQTEAGIRLKKFGPNVVTRERKATILQELWGRARNPLNALLLTLAGISCFLGDVRAAIVIVTMVILAIITAFIQEHRSNQAAAKLRAMVPQLQAFAGTRFTPRTPSPISLWISWCPGMWCGWPPVI